ncbi:MAG TPA: hemerythrin domain-containing protein [Rhizomicrobium sp.]|nr:hemerythrin domain-containing protein [Rhizomicrobium sp.]
MDIQSTARKAGRKVGRLLSAGEQTGTDTDILDLLQKDHDEVEELLDKLVESRSGSERKSLLKKIKGALVPHVRAEEKVVYDAVIAVKGKKEAQDGEEGYLEHGLADRMLATLGKISGAMSPEFGAAAKVLKELVLHHVREEENNIWSDVREHFSDDERVEMGRKFQLAKQRVRIV